MPYEILFGKYGNYLVAPGRKNWKAVVGGKLLSYWRKPMLNATISLQSHAGVWLLKVGTVGSIGRRMKAEE